MARTKRRRTWGWDSRSSSRFTTALAQAVLQQPPATEGYVSRLREDEVGYLVEQIKAGISPTSGSTAMERWATNWTPNRGGTGLFDVMDAPAFHDLDARKNPAGFPDVTAVVGHTLFLAEMKAARDKPSPRQELWLRKLAQVRHVWSGVVYPQDWEDFCEVVYAAYLEGRRDGGEGVEEAG